MAFQVIVRKRLESIDSPFAPAQVRTFDAGRPVRIADDPGADCPVPELGEASLVLEQSADGEIRVRALTGEFRLGERAPVAGDPLRNGDELVSDDVVIRLQRIYARSRLARRAGLTAVVARVLLAMIVVGEVLVAVWLPRRLRAAELWTRERAELQTSMLLDELRAETRSQAALEGLPGVAVQLVDTELQSVARYVRSHRRRMTVDRWRELRADLGRIERVLERLTRDEPFAPMPTVDLDRAVSVLLQAAAPLDDSETPEL